MTTPFVTADDAVTYLGLPSKKALYQHLRRHPIRVYRLGSRVRYHIDDLQALIQFSHMSSAAPAHLHPHRPSSTSTS